MTGLLLAGSVHAGWEVQWIERFAGDGDNVGWPNPGASEIDIWEWVGRDPAKYITNFFNTGGFACGREMRHDYPEGAVDVLDWHVYAMEWTADRISFFLDDTQVATFDWPTDCEGQWVALDPPAASQGMAFDYIDFADLLFVAWFTHVDLDGTDVDPGLDLVGARDNRWLTAQLAIDGNKASGPLFASTGGGFQEIEPCGGQ